MTSNHEALDWRQLNAWLATAGVLGAVAGVVYSAVYLWQGSLLGMVAALVVCVVNVTISELSLRRIS